MIVSVVIPAYNAEAFIAEAITSALAQSHPEIEVVCVDDGSTDRTAEIVAGYPEVRLLRRPHAGVSAARNAALEAVHGDFVGLLDADDLWPADRVAACLAVFAADPALDIVFGRSTWFLEQGARPPEHSPWWDGAQHGHPTALLARRSLFEQVGPYDESLALGEDIDWIARARDSGARFGETDATLTHVRVHATNSTRDATANRAAMFSVLRTAVGRRRTASG